MKLPKLLLVLLPRRRCRRAAAPRLPADIVLPVPEEAAADAPRGCGWFDSSHDLRHGLRVQEHLDAGTLARELPLANWLDLQLCAWRPAEPAMRQA